MAQVMTFRDLEVWQRSMELVEHCYRLSESFPKSELFGLVSQIRRAAVSIPSNIAEGNSRRSTRAYLNHVSIAFGSYGELVTLLELGCRLGLISRQQHGEWLSRAENVGRMLLGLHRSLKRLSQGQVALED